MELELRSVEVQGAHEIGGRSLQGGGRAPLSRGQALGLLVYFFRPEILVNFKRYLRGFSGHSENFSFLHKNKTMAFLLKIAPVRVSSIQIMQIRVQNKGKRVWKSRYNRDISTPPS